MMLSVALIKLPRHLNMKFCHNLCHLIMCVLVMCQNWTYIIVQAALIYSYTVLHYSLFAETVSLFVETTTLLGLQLLYNNKLMSKRANPNMQSHISNYICLAESIPIFRAQCKYNYSYSITQIQVYGLAQVRVLGLKYSRTNTYVENATVHHE